MTKVMVATNICERKIYSLQYIPKLNELTYSDKVFYLNAQDETEDGLNRLWDMGENWLVDSWRWDSTWHKKPEFNQDQARLEPIVFARNMALAAARRINADYILFVDSDVVVPNNSIEKLLELKKPLCGGVVPGRGAHSKEEYIFGVRAQMNIGTKDNPIPVTICNHGTMGFCLIHKSIFNVISFRTGYSINYWKRPKPYTDWAAEDPLFCEDSEAIVRHGGFHVRMDLRAEHYDDPDDPLTAATAAPEYDVNGVTQ